MNQFRSHIHKHVIRDHAHFLWKKLYRSNAFILSIRKFSWLQTVNTLESTLRRRGGSAVKQNRQKWEDEYKNTEITNLKSDLRENDSRTESFPTWRYFVLLFTFWKPSSSVHQLIIARGWGADPTILLIFYKTFVEELLITAYTLRYHPRFHPRTFGSRSESKLKSKSHLLADTKTTPLSLIHI